MTPIYRGLFVALSVLGLMAIALGIVGLLDLPIEFLKEEGTQPAELWVAIVVGAGLQVFAWSALPHAKLSLDHRTLDFLKFGVICGTTSVKLDDIARFGTGMEKHGYQRFHVLILELKDGSKRSIKVSMYARWRIVVDELGRLLGQAAVEGKQGWTGVHLKDD